MISFEIGAREKMSHIKKELCYNVLQNSRINRKQTKVEPNPSRTSCKQDLGQDLGYR